MRSSDTLVAPVLVLAHSAVADVRVSEVEVARRLSWKMRATVTTAARTARSTRMSRSCSGGAPGGFGALWRSSCE